MGFASGSLSFRRFAVVGKKKDMPTEVSQELLDKLAEHMLKEGEFGGPEEVEYGWAGGRHIFDAQFSFDHNVFNDAICFALRIDTNRVPGNLKKAYEIMEEEAVAKTNPSGFISKAQKKAVKEVVREKMEEEMKSGKHRRSKLVPILWDVPEKMLYCAAGGATQEKLMEIFERSFGLELQPLSAGSMGLRILEEMEKRREYEDLRPTRFVHGPDGENQQPEYAWVAKGPEPKDFIGNEFLVWLWHEADAKNGVIKTADAGEIAVFIDQSLDLDCAYGQTGKDSIRGTGPSRTPEARDALRVGKVPRKAGLVMEALGQAFTLTWAGDTLAVGGAKLPEVEEADTPRKLFEERVSMLRDLCKALDGLFASFLKVRASSSWEGQKTTIRRWIQAANRQAATAQPAVAVA